MKLIVEEITPENRDALAAIAIAGYIGEPCRICGQPVNEVDVKSSVFAGCSKVDGSRIAHKSCWDKHGVATEQDDHSHWAIPE